MFKPLVALGILMLGQYGILCAEEPDEIAKKITAAKDAYYADRDKAEQALIALLEKKEAAAKQAGDIKTIEAVRAEMEAFRKEGKLPKIVPLTNYSMAMKLARTKLENVYLAAIKSATQADNLEEAKALQKQMDDFRSGTKKDKLADDPFQPNSVWVQTNGEEHGKLVIKKRKNEIFEGEHTSIKQNFERIVTGTVKDGKLIFLAKDAKTIKGVPAANQEGILGIDDKGYYLNMTFTGVAYVGTGKYQMRLQK